MESDYEGSDSAWEQDFPMLLRRDVREPVESVYVYLCTNGNDLFLSLDNNWLRFYVVYY